MNHSSLLPTGRVAFSKLCCIQIASDVPSSIDFHYRWPHQRATFAADTLRGALSPRPPHVPRRQPLLKPMPLDMSPAEEMAVRDAMAVFQANGFTFTDDPDSGRLVLTAVPVSKRVQLGPPDVAELAALLRGEVDGNLGWRWGKSDGVHGKILRPSRVRAMLASRACR